MRAMSKRNCILLKITVVFTRSWVVVTTLTKYTHVETISDKIAAVGVMNGNDTDVKACACPVYTTPEWRFYRLRVLKIAVATNAVMYDHH